MKKLVRDKIPEIVGRGAEKVEGKEYRIYLEEKLIEELYELGKETEKKDKNYLHLLEEFGDSFTVLLALANFHGICWEEVEKEIVRKGKEKGGFGGGFVMEFSE